MMHKGGTMQFSTGMQLRWVRVAGLAVVASLALCSCEDNGFTASKVASREMGNQLAKVSNVTEASFCYTGSGYDTKGQPWLTVVFEDGSAELFSIHDDHTITLLWSESKETWAEPSRDSSFNDAGCYGDRNYVDEWIRFYKPPGWSNRGPLEIEVATGIAKNRPLSSIHEDLVMATTALVEAAADHAKRYVDPISTY